MNRMIALSSPTIYCDIWTSVLWGFHFSKLLRCFSTLVGVQIQSIWIIGPALGKNTAWRSQCWHIRVKTEQRGRKDCLSSSETRLFQVIDLGKTINYNLGSAWTLHRPGNQTKLIKLGIRVLITDVTNNPKVRLAQLQRSCVQMVERCRRPTIAAAIISTSWQGVQTGVSPQWKTPESPAQNIDIPASRNRMTP